MAIHNVVAADVTADAHSEIVGYVDSVTVTQVGGWVWCPKHPDRRLVVELVKDGVVVASSVADTYREDLQQSGIGDGRHSFSISAPETVRPWLNSVSCRVSESSVYLARTGAALFPYAYSIDILQPWGLSGWIYSLQGTDPATVTLSIDGQPVESVVADSYRADLEEAGIGKGYSGFSISFPLIYCDGQEHHIDLTVDGRSRIPDFPRQMCLAAPVEATLEADFIEGDVKLRAHITRNYSGEAGIAHRIIVDEEEIVPIQHLSSDDVEALVPAWKQDGQVHTVQYAVGVGGLLFLTVAQQELTLPRKRHLRIDRMEDSIVMGWGYDYGNPDGQLIFDVHVNGVFCMTVRADRERSDLAIVPLLRHVRHGFQFGIGGLPVRRLPLTLEFFASDDKVQLAKPIQIVPGEPWSASKPAPAVHEFAQRLLSRSIIERLGQLGQGILQREVSIVVPIYNAASELEACLDSLFLNTDRPAHLILIDDASTDPRIGTLLERVRSTPGVTIVRNEENQGFQGFTRTVNRGIALARSNDVVILNSDTIVPPQWLRNLKIAACSAPNIGTVTAISDNAGAFSMPEIGTANPLPLAASPLAMGRAIAQNNLRIFPSVPTGNGFCMYIRCAMLDAVGELDAESFPRGYGEENDLCLRALRAGWRHIIDDATWVQHVRSASFGIEKLKLMEDGAQIIHARYIEFHALNHGAFSSNSMTGVRYQTRVAEAATERQHLRPRILFVISTQTGGTPETNFDLMQSLHDRYDCFLVSCNRKTITLSAGGQVLEEHLLAEPITVASHVSNDYNIIMRTILLRYGFDLVHIRHIMWHSLDLPRIAADLQIPVVMSFHDYYSVCPTVNLVDEEGSFCAAHCTNTGVPCMVTSWPGCEVPSVRSGWISVWQSKMREMLRHCDAFVTTSRAASEILERAYPDLLKNNITLIPHGRDFSYLTGLTFAGAFLKPGEPLRVLIPGNLNRAKGLDLVRALKTLDTTSIIELHFLGSTTDEMASLGVRHGTYSRDDFRKRVESIRPHVAAILSVTAETWCHTLTECWSVGLPTIVTDRGAIAERVAAEGVGWIVPACANEIYACMCRIQQGGNVELKCDEVIRWQIRHAVDGSTARMAARYDALYGEIRARRRAFVKPAATVSRPARLRLGLIIPGGPKQFPPSSHIRVLSRFNHPLVQQRIAARHVNPMEIINPACDPEIDLVLVQRNGLVPDLADGFIEACRKRSIRICVELDDDLLDVPEQKDPLRRYTMASATIAKLLKNASLVLVSTAALARRVSQFCANTRIVPNFLDEILWFGQPKTPQRTPADVFTSEKPGEALRLVYLGGDHHIEDLEMLRPVLKPLVKRNCVTLHVIGMKQLPTQADDVWCTRITVPEARQSYPEFVSWFRSVTGNFDAGIAPLVETEFNTCKSYLKVLDYAAIGLPALCSDREIYRSVVRDRKTGFLISDAPEDWTETIRWCW